MHLVRSTCMLLLILASFILFLSDGKKSCESELLQKCISQYVELVRGKQVDGSSEQHCSRVQGVLSCFAENPSCKGKSVNSFRQWILKEAKLEVKLNICPNINPKKLEESVSNTDEAEENEVEEVDEDIACARDVHIKCNKRFLTLMTQSGESICSDAKVWFDCYKTENQECNSKLIDQYAKFVEKTYNKLASPCQRVEL